MAAATVASQRVGALRMLRQTPWERHSLMSEEEWKRVSRPKIRCPSLAHYVLNSIGVVYKRPKPENLSSLPVQVK